MTVAQDEGKEDTRQHELVIIRRRNNAEDAPHKGGVWKIAHADFMTALMAFFLVMWLINATDDKTVTGIANYFNPMRLSDATTRPKGVFTMEPAGEQEDSGSKITKPAKRTGGSSAARESPSKDSEAAMFSDPYEALDKIATQAVKSSPPQAITERGNAPAHRIGEAFRDPFVPQFQHGPLQRGEVGGETAKKDDGRPIVAKSDSDKTGLSEATSRAVDPNSVRASLTREIKEAVRQSGFSAIPGIDVRTTDEGLLISITDKSDFEMFGIASAQPKPELVVLMEKIGKVLVNRPEHLVIRGHTDGRPFRSDDYDNWRLSTARAHMASYMLMRSGIAEKRIDRIEGRADHNLKIGEDPFAAANRRIEILLEKDKP